jgi:hypothetical protein
MKDRITFEVDGILYRHVPLPALTSFHVTRKLTPLLTGIVPTLMAQAGADGGGLAALKNADFNKLGPDLLGRIAQSFSDLSDANAEFIISTCLTTVERKDKESWSRIWHASGKAMQYEDIDNMRSMLAIVVKVLEPILSDFMAGLASTPPDGEEEITAPQ